MDESEELPVAQTESKLRSVWKNIKARASLIFNNLGFTDSPDNLPEIPFDPKTHTAEWIYNQIYVKEPKNLAQLKQISALFMQEYKQSKDSNSSENWNYRNATMERLTEILIQMPLKTPRHIEVLMQMVRTFRKTAKDMVIGYTNVSNQADTQRLSEVLNKLNKAAVLWNHQRILTTDVKNEPLTLSGMKVWDATMIENQKLKAAGKQTLDTNQRLQKNVTANLGEGVTAEMTMVNADPSYHQPQDSAFALRSGNIVAVGVIDGVSQGKDSGPLAERITERAAAVFKQNPGRSAEDLTRMMQNVVLEVQNENSDKEAGVAMCIVIYDRITKKGHTFNIAGKGTLGHLMQYDETGFKKLNLYHGETETGVSWGVTEDIRKYRAVADIENVSNIILTSDGLKELPSPYIPNDEIVGDKGSRDDISFVRVSGL